VSSDATNEARAVRRVVCPGSFDPVTNGHLDIISRMTGLFDEVIVAVGKNAGKNGLFSYAERMEMIREVTGHLPNVTVDVVDGLLVDFCTERNIPAIVKGLRAVGDFDYELQMSQMNKSLAGIDSVFIPTSPEWSFIASSLVKEVARFGGDVAGLVPPAVLTKLTDRLAEGGPGPETISK
jgi:pantetheine-phosphate adenylyltransferase